jgi:hypothetical protein
MSEFKFSCPHCGQHMQATAEYSGQQIPCPACQKLLVVPPSPAAPASNMPAPAPAAKHSQGIGASPFAPPPVARLSVASTTVTSQAGAAEAAAQMTVFQGARSIKRKTPYGTIIGGVISVGALGVAAYLWGPLAYAKLTHRTETAPAEQAVTNEPPPPPIQLTAAEVLQSVINAYKGMSSYRSVAKSVSALDTSQLNPMAPKGPVTTSVNLSIKLGRPDHYRIDWERQIAATTIRGSAWSAGTGDFLLAGNQPAALQKNREAALGQATASSGALSVFIAGLFFNDTNNLGNALQNYNRLDDETINGQNCYVLAGTANFQNVQLWVNKNDSLIAQSQIVFSGKLDDASLDDIKIKVQLALLNGRPATDAEVRQKKNLIRNAAKLKGTITDTYVNIETNKTIELAEFQNSSGPINVNVSANPNQLPRGRMRGRVVTSPADMARGPRRPN